MNLTTSSALELKYDIMREIGLSKEDCLREAVKDYNGLVSRMWFGKKTYLDEEKEVNKLKNTEKEYSD